MAGVMMGWNRRDANPFWQDCVAICFALIVARAMVRFQGA